MDWTENMGLLAALIGGGAFVLSVIFGAAILPILRRLKVGQTIREEGPASHRKKAGTPTMGGISFILAFLLCVAAYTVARGVKGEGIDLIPLALTVGFAFLNACIGFVDDYFKRLKKINEGLTAPQKFILQVVVAMAYIIMMRVTGHLETAFHIPFTSLRPDLGWFAYVVYLLVLVGFVNATNLTDGVDGLASSVCAVVAAFGILFAFQREMRDVCVLFCALLGCVLGFLVYNHRPAKMFMGDTGSLFLGSVIMGCAVMADELLLFVLAGFVFVIEMISVILQVGYFKLTHGKRLFRMAPIHHHFEQCGFSEWQVVGLFSGVALLFAVLSYFGI